MTISKKMFLIVFASMVIISWSPVQADEDKYGSLNPNAPKETAQFDFLVGRWHADIKSAPDAEGNVFTGTADWSIRYILDGYALQDSWSSSDSEGNILGYGTMFRTFDAKKGIWTIVEQTTRDLSFNHMTAKKVGDTMVMYEELETSNGSLHIRRVFHNIEKDRFEWRGDISRDGGETWQEGLTVMVCTRVE